MTFVRPSDLDPASGSPTPSLPDFLAQLNAARQADAHGRELTDSEFVGSPSANGAAIRPGQSLSQMSDADLQAIATQGPSGATGRRANFSDIERAFPSAPAPQVPGRFC
jgi:hypothetical protein